MKVSFYLRNPRAITPTAIYASLCHKGYRSIIWINESIHPKDWDFKNKKPRGGKGINNNIHLSIRLNQLETFFLETHQSLTKEGLKKHCKPEVLKEEIYTHIKPERAIEKDKSLEISVTEFMNRFIIDSEQGVRLSPKQKVIEHSSIKAYKSTYSHLRGFVKLKKRNYLLEDIDQKWVDEFRNYLIKNKQLALNAQGKYMQVFGLMVKYAIHLKLLPSNFFFETKIESRREKSDNIYLNNQEVEALINFDRFSSAKHELVRDLFIIGCHTGLRYSDYSRIRKENIQGDFLEMIQSKTGGRITIPIHPVVRRILNKYNYQLPKSPCNQIFNRCLKEIGQEIPELSSSFQRSMTRNNKSEVTTYPKWKLLQSHTARRTFCTNEYLKGTSVITIMAISGHTTQKSFMSYIKASSREHAEMLMKDWGKRGE